MPSFIQANTNGRLHPADEPSLAPLNRGFLYGDAIYEVWRTYHHVLFAWDEHWTRLRESAAALHFELPWDQAQMLAEIQRTTTAFRQSGDAVGELYIRLQIFRGEGAIGLDPGLAEKPGFVLLVQRCPELSAEKLASGLRLSVARGLRRNPAECLNPAWKTGNYLNNMLCLREARMRGADEVIILNQAGEVTESAVCNVAFIRDNALVTPPLSAGILAGVTRGIIFDHVSAMAGLEIREETVRPEEFSALSECCLLSTTRDIAPVLNIDEQRFQVGQASACRRLKAAFAEYARAYASEHAAWTL